MTHTRLHGHVEPGFGPVADAFEQTLAKPGELGAAFALYVDGRLVVDVWGGVADKRTRQPWTERTLQLVFSSTKGATALCLARLVGEGRLSTTTPWPPTGPSSRPTASNASRSPSWSRTRPG